MVIKLQSILQNGIFSGYFCIVLINLFKTRTPLALFGLPLVAAILCTQVFFMNKGTNEFSYTWLAETFSWLNQNIFLNYILTLSIVIGNAMLLNFGFNRGDLFSKSTYLPGFFYVLILSCCNGLYFSSNLLAHFFIILGLFKLFELRRQNESKDLIFKASLALGIAFFLNPTLLPLILLPVVGLVAFRPFVWREYILVLIGGGLPSLFHYGIHFGLTGIPLPSLLVSYDKLSAMNFNVVYLINYVLYGLILIYSLWKYFVVNSSEVVRFKKLSRLIFHFTWISFMIVGLEFYFYNHLTIIYSLPTALIIGVSILHTRQTFLLNMFILFWFITGGLKVFF